MATTDEFAHGYHYGDYSGVNFYSPPQDGFWFDRLAVSDTYIRPLFLGVLDRAWRESDNEGAPRLATDWNLMEGWVNHGRLTPVTPEAAAELVEALANLGPADLAEHCAGCTVEQCLRCAAVIGEFIGSRQAQGLDVYFEDD